MDYTNIPDAEDFAYDLACIVDRYQELELPNKVIVAILKDMIEEIGND
jgi:hypothetical protein